MGWISGAKDQDLYGYIETTEALVGWLTLFAVVPVMNAILNRSWVKEKLGPGPEDSFGMGKLMGYVLCSAQFPLVSILSWWDWGG